MERQVSQGQSKAREQALRQSVEANRTHRTLITQETFDRLIREQEALKLEAVDATKTLADVKANEDAREQALRNIAVQEAEEVGKRIKEVESILGNHQLISPRLQTDKVRRGNTVVMQFDGDEPFSITLVGSSEDAKTRRDWTYFDSPLAAATVGKKTGDRFSFNLGSKRQQTPKSGVILAVLPGQFEGPRETPEKPQSS